jgi:DNA uptake protein ComE-like DNA-binding protein
MNRAKRRIKPEPNKVDEAIAETFPASDPPSYMGSTAVAGAPRDDGSAKTSERPVVTERKHVDLNTASPEELGSLPPLTPDMAKSIVHARPFKDWDAVRRLPGFDRKIVDELKKSGARLDR